jgi:hypothetical protein
MLAGKAEAIGDDARFLEYLPFFVITGEGGINCIESGFPNDVVLYEVTEVEECAEGTQYLGRNMAFDAGKVNLST